MHLSSWREVVMFNLTPGFFERSSLRPQRTKRSITIRALRHIINLRLRSPNQALGSVAYAWIMTQQDDRNSLTLLLHCGGTLHHDSSMISRLHAAYVEKRDKRSESNLQRWLKINSTTHAPAFFCSIVSNGSLAGLSWKPSLGRRMWARVPVCCS